MKNRDLAVVILTTDDRHYDGQYLPTVCHKISDKTMLEIAITLALKLDPKIIILICNKYNILTINKLLRDKHYSEILSIHIDNNDLGPIVSKKCYKNKDVLVMPGNSPLLSEKTLFKMIDTSFPLSMITDKLFFIKKEYIKYMEDLELIDFIDTVKTTTNELKEIKTKGDLDIVRKIYNKTFKKKNKKKRK